ncbi:MAG: DUF3050 domain-containing protein [Puia sp.]|nr:DUF3050 domain-containing protein [Puia sp.]
MSIHIHTLKEAISPVRDRLINHPIYHSIRSASDLRIFMEHHVYAVWDFMSLLKALQQGLTCVKLPWVPVGSANTRYLINEIVTGEESDVDDTGRRMSHFELYLEAMREAGADERPIRELVESVSSGVPVKALIDKIPGRELRHFLSFTFDTIAGGDLPVLAAVFTFGREDLIPDMFLRIVGDLAKGDVASFGLFTYYLERHIEVDGGHHGELALAMVEELCGEDPVKWEKATRFAIAALESRMVLWDGVLAAIADANRREEE